MRNKAIELLANKKSLKDQKLYPLLVQLYGEIKGMREIYHYQLGYTPRNFERISYDLKKTFNISDVEIALFVPTEEEIDDASLSQNLGLSAEEIQKKNEAHQKEVAERLKLQNLDEGKTHSVLTDIPEAAQEGLKIRDEYPFLNDDNCPNEFKILVSDKITAYKNYAKLHAAALEAADELEAEEKLYELAKDALKNWNLNQDIKLELDSYKDGKVLGKHPLLADLKLKQEVQEMTEADLISQRSNAQKAVNKYKEVEGKEHLYEYHSKKFELITARLEKDFNRKFDK